MRGAVTMARRALEQALEPNSGAESAAMGTGPVVETWYWTAVCPDRNTALPDTLTQVMVAFLDRQL